MLKNFIVLVLLTLGVVIGSQYIHPIIMAFLTCRDWIAQLLLQVFSGGTLGSIVRTLLSLMVIPLFLSAIPAFIYWFAKRRRYPYFMHMVWAIWLVQTTAIIMLQRLGVYIQ